ncbi:MAG: bifunctional phosphoribosylaminoimidazolecarboxamide formyltransferase/IMP cyclohydrolase [Chloroflexota bacterium]
MSADGVRIAVAVSGTGSNLRALRAAEQRGLLGGRIVLVLADQDCPALAFAHDEGIAVAVVDPAAHRPRAAWDGAVAAALSAAGVDLVVLAGFMRVLGRAVTDAFAGRILNVHPSLLPAFPGRDAIGDALAAGVAVTGVTVHLVDETLDGGPVVAQEAVPVVAGEPREALAARIHAVEHRLLPRAVALHAAGALRVAGRQVTVDRAIAAALPRPRRALLSMSDKSGLADLGRELAGLGFELVSTGGTARALREAGLPVTDVAAVTGAPEMLDGRVKTLHPRVHGGILADLRLADHREQLAAAAIEPFELVAVNLYPFEQAAAREGIAIDDLVEEIDIGGPAMVRAAAKNHASVAILTDPADVPGLLAELRATGAISLETRRRLAVTAFRRTAAYDTTISGELATRYGIDGPAAGATGADARFPDHLRVDLRLEDRLRYGENPHQGAAVYRDPAADPDAGPFARGVVPLQGKALSYNNLLDAAAAAGVARDLRGPGIAIIKHGNPCGAAEGPDALANWDRALAGDPVSAFGGVVAVRGPVDGPLAERLASLFLEVVVAERFDAEARAILAAKTGLRLLEDPSIVRPPIAAVELRSAGGAILATDADTAPDDPQTWTVATQRAPDTRERADLDLAWRVARHVKSNAIVLARDGAIVGVGAGQMSRVDSARIAVAKAGPERVRGAVVASDAFFPFPDALEVCLEAGATAVAHPGGSKGDAVVTEAADRARAAMLLTGTRHFRH